MTFTTGTFPLLQSMAYKYTIIIATFFFSISKSTQLLLLPRNNEEASWNVIIQV